MTPAEEGNRRVQSYIRKLEGVSFAEWEEIKKHIDYTIEKSVSRHKRENVLTIHENALIMIRDKFGDFPVDLTHNYSRYLPVLPDNDK